MLLNFADWLPHQRWFAGKGRAIGAVDSFVTKLTDDLDHVLLRVRYEDGDAHLYQVIVGWERAPADEFLAVARIGEAGGLTAYDALYSEPAARELLAMAMTGRDLGTVRFVPEPGAELPGLGETTARVVDAEQSNTSVVFGNEAILKLFRRMVPGVNPDLELTRVLGRAGSPHVAHLLAAIEGIDPDREPVSLAEVNVFAANAADGWAMATVSARDLIADPELAAWEAGGDFAAEAHRLGEAVASVHTVLGDELGRDVGRPPVERLLDRLRESAAVVPEVARHVDEAAAVLSRASSPTVVQRVHGDLHLGQVLRTPDGWILIDFEGEPGKPMTERREPDSPMRDVAAMLRSFDYAAYKLLVGDGTQDPDGALDTRAREWAARNRAAFCDGYAVGSGVDPRDHADLLAAYELDKAVYEAAYEARHRPSWLWIPLRSIDRLLDGDDLRDAGGPFDVAEVDPVGASAPVSGGER
jgi:maltokinase